MLASLILTFLLAASTLGLVLTVALLMRGARLRSARRLLRLKVSERRDHGNGLFTLILRHPWPRRFLPLPKYVAGQSLAVSLPQGRLRRRYSLARWQARPFRYEITVKREDEGRLSRQLAENARRGSWLNVAPPSGEFVLPGDSAMSRAVLIAGGVGITPLLAMIDQLSSQPAHPFQEVHLYWQVRSEDEWVYREELEGLARHDRRLSLHLLASRPRQGEPHRISIEMLQDDLGGLAGTVYFLCAGPSLLDSMVSGLLETGIPREAVHFERFGVLSATGAIGEWHINVDGEAAVYSGHASLLDALEDGGLAIAADCRAGSCGECRLTVLSGEVRHLIAPEFALPPGQILPCCAVPGSDVRLTSRL